MVYLMWGIFGWCGTPYPRWWWWWPGPPPPPDSKPQPDPWLPVKLGSIVGGLLGGWVTQSIVGPDATLSVLTSFAGAWAGGGFLGGIAALATRGRVPASVNVQTRT